MDDIDSELVLLRFVNKIDNLVSSFASLIIIVLYIKYRKLNNFCLELSVHLSVCTICAGLASVFDYESRDNYCLMSSAFGIFSNLATIVWVFLIGISGYKLLQDSRRFETNLLQRKILYSLVGYGIPSLVVVLVILSDTWGPAGTWCWLWVDPSDEKTSIQRKMIELQTVILYTIYWIVTIMNLVYVYRTVKLGNNLNSTNCEGRVYYSIYSKNMMIYPVLGFIIGIPRTFNRLGFLEDPNFYLEMTQTVCDSLQGFFFACACMLTFTAFKRDLDNCCSNKKSSSKSKKIEETGFYFPQLDTANMETIQGSSTDLKKSTFVLVSEEESRGYISSALVDTNK